METVRYWFCTTCIVLLICIIKRWKGYTYFLILRDASFLGNVIRRDASHSQAVKIKDLLKITINYFRRLRTADHAFREIATPNRTDEANISRDKKSKPRDCKSSDNLDADLDKSHSAWLDDDDYRSPVSDDPDSSLDDDDENDSDDDLDDDDDGDDDDDDDDDDGSDKCASDVALANELPLLS
ncbi:hypothetical protein FBUS_02936 [Fasciolopsis buskii]|uniref:Uncharacterized protein n=1 Tax=Fasciolopsis buskii TaxID=27845 RepID=A0A8E0S6C1_9TREM|nr:hypothetical protein FBUS_02936 [Fasciolopsis buski]